MRYIQAAPTLFGRSLGGCRLTREYRLTVVNDKHDARRPSCLPPCKTLQNPHRDSREPDGLFIGNVILETATISVCFCSEYYLVAQIRGSG